MHQTQPGIFVVAPETQGQPVVDLLTGGKVTLSVHLCPDLEQAAECFSNRPADMVLGDLDLLAGSATLFTQLQAGSSAPWIGLCPDAPKGDFQTIAGGLDGIVGYGQLTSALLSRAITLAFQRRTARRQLAHQDQDPQLALQASILENLSDWVTATDLQGKIIYVSPSVKDLLGYEASDLIGRPIDEAYTRAETTVSQTMDSYLGQAKSLAGEVAFQTREGSEVVVSLHTTAIQDAAGQITGLISVAHDITQRKAAEVALERAKAKLRRKNARLAELTETAHRFVDNVAHEFRTPLTVIQEFAAILTDGIAGPISAQQVEYLQIVSKASRDLGGMVNDLLDTSRLKVGTLRVNRQETQVAKIVEPVHALLAARAADKNIQVELGPFDQFPSVMADTEKAGRVLVNLVVNAVKFSPEDSCVRLAARLVDPHEVAIDVTDQGPGLSHKKLDWIFDRFRQAGQGAAAGSDKGFGLGLNIARELAWLNFGRLEVRSEPGQGSCFSLLLPRSAPADLLTCYARTVTCQAPAEVTALEATGESAETVASLRGALANHCRPMDLLLPGRKGRLLLIGLANDPAAWAKRLTDKLQSLDGEQLAAVSCRIDLLDSWHCPNQVDDFIQTVAPQVADQSEVTI